MKIVRRTPENSLEQSLQRLREHVGSVRPPRKDRPGCSKPESEGQGGADKPEDDGEAACSIPGFLPGGAHDVVKFHQRAVALELAELQNITIACAMVNLARLSLGFLQRYEQTWEYRRTAVGHPVSYISLGPLERRRVHVACKRKTSFSRSDRTKRSSRQTYDSASSTKASNSATNSSTSRNKWSASASGSYGLGGVGWGAQVEGSLEGSAEQSRQMAVENITDETEKSSTECLAETETTTTIGLQTSFEQIYEYQLANPYADRAVMFSLLELVDDFCVHTATAGITPCLIIDFNPVSSSTQRLGPSIRFDDSFVSTHRQFLRTAMLDDTLIEFLDSQLALETQPPNTGEVAGNAIRCLTYLYDETGVFAPATEVAYDIESSFDPLAGGFVGIVGTGFDDAVAEDMTDIYFLLSSVRFMYRRDKAALTAGDLDEVEFPRRATEYVIALYKGLASWAGVNSDIKRKLHDASHRTEMFRRIPAFLELAEQLVVAPLKVQRGEPPSGAAATGEPEGGEEEPAPASPSTTGALDGPRTTGAARVVNHLNCFGRYYTEEYLQFLHEWTGVAAVVELMASLDPVHRLFIDFLDFERSFVDGTAWIVPFAEVVDAQTAADMFLADGSNLSALSQIDTAIEVRMPANGVHVEAAPGQCILPGLPVPSSGWPPPPAAYMGTTPWIAGSDDFQ